MQYLKLVNEGRRVYETDFLSSVYNITDLSDYIVNKCVLDKQPITNIQLQNILYCIQRAFLKQNRIAFNRAIEAWKFGPVVPEAYYRYCGFGAMPITMTYNSTLIMNSIDRQIIDNIIESKRNLEPWEWENEIRKPLGAWATTRAKHKNNNDIIPASLIKQLD